MASFQVQALHTGSRINDQGSSICYPVFGTQYLVPGTGYQVLGTRYLVPSTWYQVLGTSTWYQVFGTKHSVPLPSHCHTSIAVPLPYHCRTIAVPLPSIAVHCHTAIDGNGQQWHEGKDVQGLHENTPNIVCIGFDCAHHVPSGDLLGLCSCLWSFSGSSSGPALASWTVSWSSLEALLELLHT